MNAFREDPPPTAISGHIMQLDETHRVVIYLRNGEYWVADLRGDRSELTDMATWLRFLPAALTSDLGRAAALAELRPLTPELIERLEAFHQRRSAAPAIESRVAAGSSLKDRWQQVVRGLRHGMLKHPRNGYTAKLMALLVAGLVGLAAAGTARAQGYPAHAVTIIVPFAAGGPTDTLARVLAQRMTFTLGQSIVIENVSGASGSIGVGRVARSAPDGYTISIGNITTHVFNGAIYPLPYDMLKDFEPIAMVASNPQLLLGRRDIAANTLQELVAWMKAQPGPILIGTTGNGSSPHVSAFYLERTLAIPATMVPYRGAAPALQALMAGQIDILFDQEADALPQVRAKTVKAYAVTAKNPLVAAADIPTVDAAGLPGFYMTVWHGLWAPKGTPADVIAKLNAALVEALADSGVRARLTELGQEIPAPGQQSPQALGAFQKAEIEKWWPLIKAANIKAE